MNFKEWARDLEMGENDFLEILNLFLETTYRDLGKLQSAVEEREAPEAVKTAHSIRGAAANLGLTEIYEAAKRMETEASEGHLESVNAAVSDIKRELDLIVQALSKE